MRAPIIAVLCLAGALGMAGCTKSDVTVGKITQLSPQLCIGRHAATGGCYQVQGMDSSTLAALHIGDCVQVTASPAGNGAGSKLVGIEQVPASEHQDDCPSS